MKRKMRTRKSLTVKKRVVGFFAIAVILLGVIGGFGFTHVIAESNSTTGGGADRSAPVAVVASKATGNSGLSGGGSNSQVLISNDNTGTSTGTQTKNVSTDDVPSVNVNNMSTYPQTGDAHDTGLIITGFTILIGLFAFYGYKLRKSLKFLQVSK
ncbi:LPXTG cell wall anchor domain-containing protein [Companilactobacillus zhachilii]|uniref:LPXTG cell wall anchor domain-containing protein n=1 Tax=Companilactobacillus zhachilii TaxID=2304606 RepID=UPI001922EB6F|nr:LPXTG cell wall anchor domain-containing protein [Companilactobacillus zhachilii]MBL3531346.1 LPXTG cell wall anchor domain-containing protein [Companilactobacillus zhachilii]